MKRKILLFGLIGLFGLFGLKPVNGSTPIASVYAEEVFEEKTYTAEKNGESWSLTLTSETECYISDGLENLYLSYEVVKENVIKLIFEDEFGYIELKSNGTFDVYKECTVSFGKMEHGDVYADIYYGLAGEIVTLNVESELFYIATSVTVNGTTLIESETTKGVYTFALVEGENVVNVKFDIDKETLGIFSDMYQEAVNKDWTNLFSIKNVLSIIGWILDGGLLLVIVRYFIKDKKLASAVEGKVEETMNKIVPDTTKQAVVNTVEKVITPVVTDLNSHMVDITNGLNSVVKCIALMQENTPESRKAVIDELSTLKIGDQKLLEEIKKFIEETIANALKEKESAKAMIEEINKSNEKILESSGTEEDGKPTYDGTSI